MAIRHATEMEEWIQIKRTLLFVFCLFQFCPFISSKKGLLGKWLVTWLQSAWLAAKASGLQLIALFVHGNGFYPLL